MSEEAALNFLAKEAVYTFSKRIVKLTPSGYLLEKLSVNSLMSSPIFRTKISLKTLLAKNN